MGRREALGAAVAFGAAFVGGQAALADGAVSATTVYRNRGIYGARILVVADAISKGNLKVARDDPDAFVKFISGVYTLPGKGIKEVTIIHASQH